VFSDAQVLTVRNARDFTDQARLLDGISDPLYQAGRFVTGLFLSASLCLGDTEGAGRKLRMLVKRARMAPPDGSALGGVGLARIPSPCRTRH
jgi:hypothetical protein